MGIAGLGILMEPTPGNRYLLDHARRLLDSYLRLTGRDLVAAGDPAQRAQHLYQAPFVVLSHDTAPDPVFNYANLTAQRLFDMDWATFITVPSRLSAGPMHRNERQRLLNRVARNGYIDNYAGIRVAKSGKQFRVESATVWNLTGDDGKYAGQAATFPGWVWL